MFCEASYALLTVVVFDIAVCTNEIKLTPKQIDVSENSSATLTCSKVNGILAETRWQHSQITGDANLAFHNGQCIVTRFLLDSDLFDGVCHGNGTYSVVIKRINRTQHGVEWICKESISSISNKVVIQVSVSAVSVTLKKNDDWDYMKENQTKIITCSTSPCRPDPRVQWYLRNRTGQVVANLTQFSTNNYVNGEYDLKSVKSVLDLRLNRTTNNLLLLCEVWTRSIRADITSGEISINVTFPPESKPVILGFENINIMRVIESETENSVCSISGGNPVASLSWNCFGSNEATTVTQGSTVKSTVKWTASRNYNICSCTSHHILSDWKRTTNLTVNVQYPPTAPHFKIGQTIVFGDIRVIQNNTLRVACNSESNPLSNYTWTGTGFSGNGDTLEITSVKMSNQGNYECKASNRMTRTDGSYEDRSQSSSLSLTILYPPSNPKFKFENSSGPLIQSNIFYVVRNDTFSIYCDVKGNPVPDIKWDDSKSNPSLRISNINSDLNSTCRATNVMKETASQKEIHSKSEASLSIIVFYSPGFPTIHASNYNGDIVQVQKGNVSIIESETINVTCFSKSKPLPTYKWINEQSFKTQSTNILKFVNISRHDSGTYACNVENNMTRSIGGAEVGKSKSKIILNILYPAIVNALYDVSIVEGTPLELLCPVEYGNPSNSTVTWSRLSDGNRWNNIQLSFKNVSRADDANYTCSVTTNMNPTIGRSSKIEARKSFHLNVFFPSEINKFSISPESSDRTFVVNKTQNITVECIAEANPSSDLKIKSPRGDYIIEVSQSNIARHTLRNASFKDAGEYICTGRNNYTRDSPSQSTLLLIVKSRPRPSSGDTSVKKVATVLNVDVTLPFQARNYLDEPNKTIYSWSKENVSISNNEKKYIIQSNDLQTNITIRNTTQQDLGLYKVDVENSVGMYTHFYELKATDKPEPPRDFRVMNDTITDTSVTLSWRPGFNGGFQQTFVIIYKMIHELVWLNKSIKENGDINMNYTLNDLSSLQEYEIKMFARNIEGLSFHTERFYFKTKAQQKSQVKSPAEDKSGIIAGSISAVVVVVVMIVIVVVIFTYRKRRDKSTDSLYQNVPFFGQKSNGKQNVVNKAKKKRRNCPTNETTFEEKSSRRKQSINGEVRKRYNSEEDEHAVEGLQEVDDVPIILNERTEYCNSPDKIDKIDRITIAELHAYVSGNDDSLEAEYQKLPTGLQKSCTFARKPENLALNRYNGIYPYDHSRVKIPEHPDFFINACYINGYRKKKAYIASLGPTSKTTSDFKTFWQMVWHERSDMIIMLTKLHEPSGMKCEKYWPNKGTDQQYGDVIVTCETYEAFAEYTIRTFRVSKGNQHRSLTHLHYTAWPDKTVPEDITSLLDLRKRMKDVPITQGGPIIIHCSAGIGRTGTLIALDILIEEGLDKDSVNVFECVDNLRTQRVKMVQTVEQYIYIHKCLVNALSYEGETILKEMIHEQVHDKNDKQYIMLFKQLNSSVETDNSSEQKARLKNRNYSNKNRQEADVPGDRFIVFLNLTDGKEGSEYINAVYVNSFRRKDHFIVAQSPLPNTIIDFVSMIFQEDCSCIATMEDLKEPGMTVGTYLPEMNKKAIFGNFQVSSSQLEETSAYIIRKVKIKYTNKNADGEKCFYHFQYKNWMTGSKTPGNVADFVNFISEVEEYANELGEDRSRVVVHCLKAYERSCLFCAVAIIIEKLKVEGKVNILNVIRHLRTRRRTAIVSKEQLKFCYEAASAYIKQSKH